MWSPVQIFSPRIHRFRTKYNFHQPKYPTRPLPRAVKGFVRSSRYLFSTDSMPFTFIDRVQQKITKELNVEEVSQSTKSCPQGLNGHPWMDCHKEKEKKQKKERLGKSEVNVMRWVKTWKKCQEWPFFFYPFFGLVQCTKLFYTMWQGTHSSSWVWLMVWITIRMRKKKLLWVAISPI